MSEIAQTRLFSDTGERGPQRVDDNRLVTNSIFQSPKIEKTKQKRYIYGAANQTIKTSQRNSPTKSRLSNTPGNESQFPKLGKSNQQIRKENNKNDTLPPINGAQKQKSPEKSPEFDLIPQNTIQHDIEDFILPSGFNVEGNTPSYPQSPAFLSAPPESEFNSSQYATIEKQINNNKKEPIGVRFPVTIPKEKQTPQNEENITEEEEAKHEEVKSHEQKEENKYDLYEERILSQAEVQTPYDFSRATPQNEKIVIEEEEEEPELDDSNIPPRLLELIPNKRESLAYLALSGASLIGYKTQTIKKALKELKLLLSKCIDNGYLNESIFTDNTIKRVADELKYVEKNKDTTQQTIYQLEDQLSQNETEMKQKAIFFESHRVKLNADKDLAQRELYMHLQEDLEELDREWFSQEKADSFARPSTKLVRMRKEAMHLLSAKRFEEASALGNDIEELAEKETVDAMVKMRRNYENAVLKRQKQFLLESQAIDETFDRKVSLMQQKKKKVDYVLTRRADKINNKKALLEIKQAKENRNKKVPASAPLSPSRTARTILTTDIKPPGAALQMRPITKMKRKKD